MKKLFLFQFALLFISVSMAQVPNYEWARTTGGTDYDRAQSVVVDKSGNVYTTGYFMDQVDFDPDPSATSNLTSNGGFDIYISKLDANGKFVWAVNIGGSDDDAGNSIKLDVSGNIYVTGYFQSKFDFDPGSGTTVVYTAGGSDIFVSKFDASGNFVWVSQMGGSGEDVGNGITLDASGNVYTTGYFNETTDFDPSTSSTADLTSYGGMDIFISKLDGKGNYIWAGQMGGAADDAGNGIALDSLGNSIFSTGYFMDKANFDPNPKSSGTYIVSLGDADIFVCKLDAKGNFTWAVPAGGAKYPDVGMGIVVDGLGNNYTTGYFYSAPDFNPDPGKKAVYTLTSNGDADIFVWKLDGSGTFVWAKNMGGTSGDYGASIALDGSKNVFTTGVYEDAADFDPGTGTKTLTAAGAWDIFISKLDVSGNYDWALGVGETDDEGGTCISVDNLKSVYITGAFLSSKLDFNPGTGSDYYSPVGAEDAFVIKLSLCKASMSEVKAKACNSYTYNGNTYFKGGDYSTTLKNSIGCDSIVTLKLTLNTTSFYTLNATACSSYVANGQTYTAEGSYNQTLTNKAGCDSFLVIELKFLTSTGNIKTKACNTYTINSQTFTKTGNYTQILKNKAGCDSTLTLNLTIVKSTVGNVTATACESYKLFGTTYIKSGIYNQVEKNVAGCDSNITLNLTIHNGTFETLNKDACSSYKLNAQTYTKSGTYMQVIPNKKGCDSTITLNLSINNTSSAITTTACQSYKLNNQTYTSSGLYVQTIPNAKSCDSTITLNLTVNKVITTVTNAGGTLTADAVGAAYQWVDCNNANAPVLGEMYQSFTPTVTGNYAVKVTKNNCKDMSNCFTVKVGGIKGFSDNSIHVFPNPTSNEVNIVISKGLKKGSIKLISVAGQILNYETNLSGNNFGIDLSQQAKGIYFIEINQDDKVYRTKVVKN